MKDVRPAVSAGMLVSALLAVLFFIPGIFDPTYNSRLAAYPAAGAVMLLAGAGGITIRFALASAMLPALQIAGLLPGGAVPGAIPQIVRWLSFWMMLCGASGMLRTQGRGRVFGGIALAAALIAVLSLILPDDLPSGNPNRQGPLLAISLLAVSTGMYRPGRAAGAALVLLIAAGLWRSGFYTAMAAAVSALAWFLLRRRRRTSLQGIPIAGMILLQAFLLIRPQAAAAIHPSLELRTLIWRSGFALLDEAGPAGTGTAVSRLGIMAEGTDRMQELAGPDSRVDFLHSEILTLPVEQGVAGMAAVALSALLAVTGRMSRARGSALVCCWPFLAIDLPLATPLGAIPIAAGLAWASGTGAGRLIGRAAVRTAALIALVLAVAWAFIVIAGNRLLSEGIRAGATGRNARSAEMLDRASALIPWEERTHFYGAVALARDSKLEEAVGEAREFVRMYPSYWRGWALEGDLLAATGRRGEAAGAYLQAILTAPAGTDSLELVAFNAAAAPPPDTASAEILAMRLIEAESALPAGDPAIRTEFARRASGIAAALPPSRADLHSILVRMAVTRIQGASSLPGYDPAEARSVMVGLIPLVSRLPLEERLSLEPIVESVTRTGP
ncbi:MAG: hypothetical protein QUS11_04910 [Candidatus Fermentibacter sp.]|nr:hypothetical protein [Candidatus Fermentibacter sp.]